MRHPIRFEKSYEFVSKALFLSPSDSYVEITGDDVVVRMAWGFRARFPRSSVARTARLDRAPMSRGVHGFGGRWLVNGAGDRILTIDLDPTQRAYVMGFPVRLRELMVSVDDPERLADALRR